MILQGDSLAVGIAPYVHAQRVSAEVGRGTAEGVRLLARQHPSGRIVLVSLGTNDSWRSSVWFRRKVRRVERLVGDGCVAWGTTPNAARLNRVLLSERGGRFRVVRHVRPGPDGVHPTPHGYRVLARRYRRAARYCEVVGHAGIEPASPGLQPGA